MYNLLFLGQEPGVRGRYVSWVPSQMDSMQGGELLQYYESLAAPK